MADSIQNNVVFQLTWLLSQGGSSVTVSPDINNGWAISLTGADILLTNQNWTKYERVIANVSGWTMTLTTRWIKRDQALTTDSSLQLEWRPWTKCVVTIFANGTFNAAWNNTISGNQTFTGKVWFSGTTNPWITVNNLTTAQRNALTATNGTIVYDTDIGQLYQYLGWAWYVVAAWGTQPNMDNTTAGKWQKSTQAHADSWTATWVTGSPNVITSDVFQQWITNRLADQSTVNTGTDTVKIVTPATLRWNMASDAEVTAGSIQTKWMNPKQAKDNYWITLQVSNDVIKSGAGWNLNGVFSYTKVQEVTCNFTWTYRIFATLAAFWWWNPWITYFKVYKNWIAYWTEHSYSSYSWSTTVSDDLAFTAWDKIQWYWYIAAQGTGGNLSACNVCGKTVATIVIPT